MSANQNVIDIAEIILLIFRQKWLIVKITFIFSVLGLVIAFTTPKEYESTTILIPEAVDNGMKLGNFSSIASLAGIDIGSANSGSTTINPGLYESIAQSTPFLYDLMYTNFYFEKQKKSLSLYEYILYNQESSLMSKVAYLPMSILSWFKTSESKEYDIDVSDGIIRLTEEEFNVANALLERVKVSLDWELNVISIEVLMQDRNVSAEVTRHTANYITNYVIDYSISKSEKQLEFILKQLSDKRESFENAQKNLADFRDKNRNVNKERIKSEEERLQSEYNLAFDVYNKLAIQYEQTKLQVNENRPVFTVLEPAQVPVKKASPKRLIILILSTVLGGFCAIGFILYKGYSGKIVAILKSR